MTAFFKRRDTRQLPECIDIDGRLMPLAITRSPLARRAALKVDAARGEIRLTLPARVPMAEGLRLIEANRQWIAGKVAALPYPRPIRPGGSIPFNGSDVMLDWQPGLPRTPELDVAGKRLSLGGPLEGLAARVERWMRREALRLLTEETRHYAQKAGCVVEAVRAGDPKGRWGSCSSRSRIAYSWRLVLAPDWVRHAVVAHEVAHLVHLNHSPAFHALHRQILGCDPARAKAWLAVHGPALYWVGRER